MSLIRGEQISGSVASASYAVTASYSMNSGAVFPYSGSAVITGSLIVSSSGITVIDSIYVSGSTATIYFEGGAVVTATGANLDMTAGPGGWSELGSSNGQNYVWVDDNGLYLVSSWDGNVQTSAWRISTGSRQLTAAGDLDMNGFHITGSLFGTASYALDSGNKVVYVTSSNSPISEIEVADYDNNVAVTYVNGRLKFIFGTPSVPSAPVASFNGTFDTDRFNKVFDTYTLTGTIAVNGYTLVSASLYEGGVFLTSTGSNATQLIYSANTTSSHTYILQVTASSPLDNSLNYQTVSLSGTLSKSNPGNPSITPVASVQLGVASNQIEQGATGSITFTSASGAANSWVHNFTNSNVASPIFVTGSATGSTAISITATSYYSSSGVNGSDNSPALTTTTTATTTYSKIRSLRYGASESSSFTLNELENISRWDTTLGGSIGTISKGTTSPSGQSVTITWTGDKYHYIVYNSGSANLTNITAAGFGVLSSFTLSAVGSSYKVYRTNTLQAGGSGQSITYVLT